MKLHSGQAKLPASQLLEVSPGTCGFSNQPGRIRVTGAPRPLSLCAKTNKKQISRFSVKPRQGVAHVRRVSAILHKTILQNSKGGGYRQRRTCAKQVICPPTAPRTDPRDSKKPYPRTCGQMYRQSVADISARARPLLDRGPLGRIRVSRLPAMR